MYISYKTNVALLLAVGCLGTGPGCTQTTTPSQPAAANAATANVASAPAAGSDSRYVAVDLNALANDGSTLPLQGGQSAVDNVPFNLVTKEGQGNLFLHNAGWPDWKQDPLDFYAAYDAAGVKNKYGDVVPVAQVPVDDYSAVYVLASCENDAAYSNVLALRIGVKSSAQTTYHDYEFTVPRRNEKAGENAVRVLPTPQGNAFLLRLPLNGSFSQPFEGRKMLDVEITKKLRLAISKPDAARYQYRPLGLPSGVRLYGMTFERAPVRFALQGAQPGQVFNEPEIPTFTLQLKPQGERRAGKLTVRARATDYYGKEIEFPVASTVSPESSTQLKLPVTRRGYYVLNVTLEEDGKVLLKRQTSFALLPKDTRKHRDRSPFGTWDFTGAHYTPKDPDVMGPLYVKAGLRYGMFNYPEEVRRKYGILQGQDPTMFGATSGQRLDNTIAGLKKAGTVPERFMVFHEDNISGNQIMRVPSIFTGYEYKLNEGEQKKFKSFWDAGVEATTKMRKEFPGIKIYFGNAVPHILEPFLKNKYPAELIDYASNEAASFQRPPETQPTEFISNNASMWMGRKLLDAYGYKDTPMGQCYEVMYTSSNPGNLTLSEQADYTVRNVMHSLAWKVPIIRFQGIADIGNSYYYGNWGGVGLLNALPDLSPKPLYVATATMTQMLDGADFTRIVPTGSTTVYAFEFKKPDGGFVTCLWTPNAPRNVSLKTPQGALTVTDLMFNQQSPQPEQGVFKMAATQAPVFIESAQPLLIEAGAAIDGAAPLTKVFPISALSDANQWQVEDGLDIELSSYNFMQPRLNAPFEVKNVAEFDGKSNVLEVKPLKPEMERWWLPQYTRLKLKQPVTVEGQPTHVGLMVNGNGGWGRVVFEFEDAAGQRWSSLGAEMPGGGPNPLLANYMSDDAFKALQEKKTGGASVNDWNSNDVWGRSMINFAGWRYLQFPLPGNYPGEGYQWPYSSQWRCVKADGMRGDYVVHYPLKFTALAVTARSKVLYGTQEVPVDRPEIYLKDLGVTYGDPDTVFWKPDPGQK